jgi:prevent-host-death family protein
MKTASISELKAHLSRYLRDVRRGDEVQVLDRGRPVARLTGLAHRDDDGGADHRSALIRAGVLRPGTGRVAEFLQEEPLRLGSDLRAAVDDDRADRV